MRVLVTGGGTGGHVNPALAIANTIKKNIPDAEIAFVGTVRGLENQLVPKAGYKLYHVDVRGIRRSLSLYNIRSLWLAAVSPVKAKKIIKEFKPEILNGSICSKATADTLTRALSQVTAEGTAKRLRTAKCTVAGKTGTAENPHGDDHSLFMGFAPADNPQIAIAVVVENAGFGSQWAAPIASLMIEKYLRGYIKNTNKEKRFIE